MGDLDGGEVLGRARIFLGADHLVIGGQAGLGLGLARFCAGPNPFQFLGQGALAGFAFALLLHHALLLLFQPAGIVALIGHAFAAIELQGPLGHLIQEVAVVGHQDHAAGEGFQVVLQPGHGLGVQVVGGLVQQQHVGLGQQQAGQGDAALFTAR